MKGKVFYKEKNFKETKKKKDFVNSFGFCWVFFSENSIKS